MAEKGPEKDDLRSLKAVNSLVSARDMQIWENVAHRIHREKEIEKFKRDIALKQERIAKAKEQTEMYNLISQAFEENIQAQKSAETQAVDKLYYEEFLRDLRKKHAEAIQEYEEIYKQKRAAFEKSSKPYQELKKKEAELKRLRVKQMNLDVAIANRKKSIRQYEEINKKRWQQTVVKFADFYLTYHKFHRVSKELDELKKVEKALIEENIRLTEAAQKKKRQMSLTPSAQPITENVNVKAVSQVNNVPTDLDDDQLLKFLEEDEKSSTPSEVTQNFNFNKDKTKVQILDVKILPQVPELPPPILQADPDFVKKIRATAAAVIEESKKSKKFNAFRFESFTRPPSLNTSQVSQTSQSSQTAKKNLMQRDTQPAKVDIKEMCKTEPTAKETNSILKPIISKKEDIQSKYFKKTVTFNEKPKREDKYQLFNMQHKREPAVVKFSQPKFYGELSFSKNTDNALLEIPETNDTANVSFTLETDPTNGTFGCEKTFEGSPFIKSFDTSFLRETKNQTENTAEPTSFFHFGSQSKPKNLFDF